MEAFRRAYQEAMSVYGNLQTEVLCTINACNENREFEVINRHYRAAEGFMKELGVLMFVVRELYEKRQSGFSDVEREKARKMVAFLERLPSASMSWLMEVFRCWLAENELNNALRE